MVERDEAPAASRPPLNRMAIAVLALIGLMIAAYMSLFKMGLLGYVVCGDGNCDRVQNSPWAVLLGIPVPYIGVLGYLALMVTALAGMQPRFLADRRVSLVLLAGALIGLIFSAYLTYLEAAVINAWCRYCIASAILATLIFLSAIPEIGSLRRRA